MKKKYIILFIIFCVLIFLFFYYKIHLNGNNIIKQSQEDIVDSILSGKLNYKANIKIKIYSNKNKNEYEINQEESENYSYFKVVSNGDINGLLIENKNNTLYIRNTELKLDKIYENYEPMTNNCLFLNSFGKEYQESDNEKKYEETDCIVISLKINNSNKYIRYKELYLDKKSKMPKKLIIRNSDKQVVVCIEYTNIEIM